MAKGETGAGAHGFAPPRVSRQIRADGATLYTSQAGLPAHRARLIGHLFAWAERAPDRVFLQQRQGTAWRSLTYAATARRVREIGGTLLALGLDTERPLAVLSQNSIEHALVGFAAQAVGIPFSPVSVPYSLADRTFGKLRHILAKLTPGIIFVDAAAPFADALALPEAADAAVYALNVNGVDRARPFDELISTRHVDRADAAIATADPDAPSKILFTSGSTGMPKGVIATQRMMAVSQEQMSEAWTFLREEPPVLLDWLPWNHVFGGSHNLGMTLRHGGTFCIDEGRPVPGAFDTTLANLRDVSPTLSFNVPKGYELLIPRLEEDPALAATFFDRLRIMFYAGAALASPLWTRLEALARKHAPHRAIHMVSSWGLTETAPSITFVHIPYAPVGCVGTPLPGVEVLLRPDGDKLEGRVRGPNVTPGYWRDPDATRNAFDAEGFFLTGDAMRWIDIDRPELGLCFDGRLAEDFKLSSGTRVNVGEVRIRALAALVDWARDLVIVGENRQEIGAMIVPHEHRRAAIEATEGRTALSAIFEVLNEGTLSSRAIRRAIVLETPPSLALGEITDKGSLNVRAILRSRASDYAALFDDSDLRIIRV